MFGFKSNNDDNQSNRIVNLSHVLLARIINYIDDNVDRIVFTLVCKRWHNERHRYLSFNTHHIDRIKRWYNERHRYLSFNTHHIDRTINEQHKNNIFLNSYKSIYIDSINRKNDNHLFIRRENQRYSGYCLLTRQRIEINEIFPINVDSIEIGTSESEVENIYRMITRSNVTKLIKCNTLRYRLPENLTYLSFGSDLKEPLLPGYLPPHLKYLNFEDSNFSQPIDKGLIPNGLEVLILGISFDQPLEPGVLPSSLKYLVYSGTHHLKVGSLPPNLEEFMYYNTDNLSIDDGALPFVLPLTLQKLTAPVLWLPSIKSLSNLKSLSLLSFAGDTIDLSYLPCSLTKLDFEKGHLISTMPPSIKHLELSCTIYDTNEIFKDRSQYQFNYLLANAKKVESLQGLKIKRLDIELENNSFNRIVPILEIGDLPDGIETLRMGRFKEFRIKVQQIPTTVRKLVVHSLRNIVFAENQPLPVTLQKLVIKSSVDKDKLFPSDILPPSLESLSLPSIQLPQPRIPNNLVLKLNQRVNNQIICLRRLDDHHFLFLNEAPCFLSAIVHESDILKTFTSFELLLK
ncbi:hypothetical protein PPL_06535 [Heterostelium album PN500]|uniref:COI1 F-box domain-containing protein n=1 Tax=Heterostelium pallidum (strain ATCC 26659 / Pp 5 / PN500) TaxID=670386 RepID=D3BDF2_HETP5|nr:hypothetical protein PPL_06535 [Heterostelium album PN500]EFA80596.1 hypothetical protein PPL_06535 [Heterostelium album PN500]|eukprot:XP_020432716.1 hypothetical protein PPL_06535 [Heterostelium album PN500]